MDSGGRDAQLRGMAHIDEERLSQCSGPTAAEAFALENAGQFDEAARAYDAALRAHPSNQEAAEGRARIALLRGENAAAEHCQRALNFHEGNPELQLQMIVTAAAELGEAAIPLLEDFVRRHPSRTLAHVRLAELRAQAGAEDAFAESFVEALRERPEDTTLQRAYWGTLSRAGRHEAALAEIDAARSQLPEERETLLLEAMIASHAGLMGRTAQILDRLDDLPDAQLIRGQHRLQTGHFAEAARTLQMAVLGNPEDLSGWALLALAWRLTGDLRHEWLCGQPNLYGSYSLGLPGSELEKLAELLRHLHRFRARPLGQSVRGGTQTPGILFNRPEPEIARLVDALTQVIRSHVAQLPALDPRHPLLRHRNSELLFGGSWSVRLTEGGFHVAHLHPGGLMSSACYISLPTEISENEHREGWLEIGRPPTELKLDLAPLTVIEPRAGTVVLFPSFVFHGTRQFSSGERLTVAFDIVAV